MASLILRGMSDEQLKICKKCRVPKEHTEFWKQRNSPDGLRYDCKDCCKQSNISWYEQNKDDRRETNRKNQRKVVSDNRQFVFEYLSSHACVDCGNSNPLVLEFDHVRGQKRKAVSMMMSYSRKTLEAEMAKCEIRCANCHRIRTAKVHGWYSDLI